MSAKEKKLDKFLISTFTFLFFVLALLIWVGFFRGGNNAQAVEKKEAKLPEYTVLTSGFQKDDRVPIFDHGGLIFVKFPIQRDPHYATKRSLEILRKFESDNNLKIENFQLAFRFTEFDQMMIYGAWVTTKPVREGLTGVPKVGGHDVYLDRVLDQEK